MVIATLSPCRISRPLEFSPFCFAADLLSLDDLSIGVPKQRLLVKLVPGYTKEDRLVRHALGPAVAVE